MTDIAAISSNSAMLAVNNMRAGEPETLAKRLHALPQGPGMDAAARKTANEFEAMFLTQMLEHMSSGIKADGPFGGGQGEEMFRSLLNQQYAEQLTKRGGIGIADHVLRQILALQEA